MVFYCVVPAAVAVSVVVVAVAVVVVFGAIAGPVEQSHYPFPRTVR